MSFEKELDDWVETGAFGGLGALQTLTIVDFNLSKGGLHPGALNELASVHTIELSRCCIARIEPGLFRTLNNLHKLDLSSNRLEACLSIEQFACLESLNLSSNRITSLEGAFCGGPSNGTLRYLNLSDNRLEHLPEGGFVSLSILRSLDLASNKLDSLPPRALNGLFNLQELDLSSTGLKSIVADLFRDLINLKGIVYDVFKFFFLNKTSN